MANRPPLSLVVTHPTTSRTLGKFGRNLWDRITSEYDVADAGGLELLTLACQALDRAEALRARIDRDGEIILRADGGVRDHPGLKHELAARSFVARTLSRLGLDVEPLRPGPGHPVGPQPTHKKG
jgi:hypothetical protein